MRNGGFNLPFILALVLVTTALAMFAVFVPSRARGLAPEEALKRVDETRFQARKFKERIGKALPSERRVCEARNVNQRNGSAEVTCRDSANPDRVLQWFVSAADGTVSPANPPTVRLDSGVDPWPKN